MIPDTIRVGVTNTDGNLKNYIPEKRIVDLSQVHQGLPEQDFWEGHWVRLPDYPIEIGDILDIQNPTAYQRLVFDNYVQRAKTPINEEQGLNLIPYELLKLSVGKLYFGYVAQSIVAFELRRMLRNQRNIRVVDSPTPHDLYLPNVDLYIVEEQNRDIHVYPLDICCQQIEDPQILSKIRRISYPQDYDIQLYDSSGRLLHNTILHSKVPIFVLLDKNKIYHALRLNPDKPTDVLLSLMTQYSDVRAVESNNYTFARMFSYVKHASPVFRTLAA